MLAVKREKEKQSHAKSSARNTSRGRRDRSLTNLLPVNPSRFAAELEVDPIHAILELLAQT